MFTFLLSKANLASISRIYQQNWKEQSGKVCKTRPKLSSNQIEKHGDWKSQKKIACNVYILVIKICKTEACGRTGLPERSILIELKFE